MAEEKELKIPATPGKCVDALYTTRQKRLELQRKVKELEEYEAALKNHLINTLPKDDASGVAGKLARATIVQKEVPTISDWDGFCKYMSRTKSFDMIQRRINTHAVQARLDDGKKVAGIEMFLSTSVSINKISK